MAFVVFDTETTGFSPETGDRIIEIAAVRVLNGALTDETFDSLMNPHRIVPAEAMRVNGISQEMLESAPEADVVIPRFLEFIGTDTLVAHNAEFDMRFLQQEMIRLGLPLDRLPKCLCTVTLSRKKFPDLDRHNLDALVQHLDLRIERRHRALDDVIATAHVFTTVYEQAPSLF